MSFKNKPKKAKAPLLSGLENVLAPIRRPEIIDSYFNSTDRNLITDFHSLASYSWLEASHPSIVVPAAPPVWLQPRLPLTLSILGEGPKRLNTQALPKFSPATLVSSILSEQAAGSDAVNGFKFSGVDAVSDRSTLRRLLRWIESSAHVRDFRIDVQLAGSTVIFTRREPTDNENTSGYDHAFERAATRHNSDETGHHRIITYTLGGVKLLVRYKVDAHLLEAVPHASGAGQANVDALTAQLDSARISDSTPTISSPLVTVERGGKLVAQSETMELKIRNWGGTAYDWTGTYLQLVLSQTPHLALGWHDRGTFNTIKRKTLQELEQGPLGHAQHKNLYKLGEALRRICEIVRKQGEGKLLSLACEKGALTLRRRTDRPEGALPAEMLQLFKTS